jgi:hypothetical protein
LNTDGLLRWLKTQPAATKFNSMSITDCVLCRFMTAMTERSCDWGDVMHRFDGYNEEAHRKIVYGLDDEGPFTYRAVLSRAKALRDAP